MKKTILFFSILFVVSATTVYAQRETSAYENWMDTIAVRSKLLEHTQFFLGEKVTLIRDTVKYDAVYKKDGSWKMFDVRIFFKKGLKGIFEKEEFFNGRHVIWVKFEAEVKVVEDGKLVKGTEFISIPFTPTGTGSINLFATTGIEMQLPEIDEPENTPARKVLKGASFEYEGHNYQIFGSGASLHISKEMMEGFILARDVKVRN